jgi:hypothetical protein
MMRVLLSIGLWFALVALIAPSPAALSAQTVVYVPDNNLTTGSTNSAPFGFFSEWRFQLLVDGVGLPATPFRILDVGIVPQAGTTYTASQCQIRMTHSTLANFQNDKNFNTNIGPCPTEVFNGPISFPAANNQWSNLGLAGSFGFDGKRNLLCEIRLQNSSANVWLRTAADKPLAIRRLMASGTGAYSATTGSVDTLTSTGSPKLSFTIDPTVVLLGPDTVRLGAKGLIQLVQARAGDYYQMAASLGQMPINLGKYKLFVTPDNVFIYSVLYGVPIFNGYAGTVSALGTAPGTFIPPKIPALVGVCVYHAALTFDKAGLTGASNTAGLEIVP